MYMLYYIYITYKTILREREQLYIHICMLYIYTYNMYMYMYVHGVNDWDGGSP
jgi:hypothetical protein